MVEAITQSILAFTLLFAVITILPKTIILLRAGETKRGMMYVFMILVCGFFMVLSITLAVDSFKQAGVFR